MISTDRRIFEEGSAVRARQAEYAKEWEEVHIIIFQTLSSKLETLDKSKIQNQKTETAIAPNCWAYSTRSWSRFMYPFDAIRLGRFIAKNRGITNLTCQDASITAIAGMSLKRQFGIPVEIQIHEDIGSPFFAFDLTHKIRKALALSHILKADHIRVVSNKIKEYVVGTLGVSDHKVEVRPIFVDKEAIRHASISAGADLRRKYPRFEKIVLVASRLEREKNVRLALDAWPLVLKRLPKVGLVIVGAGSWAPKLKEMAKRNGIVDSVAFEDWVDRETLISYYKTADLFLNTSLFEGYGMALVEANAAGCKIVSTDVGVAREVGARITGWDASELAQNVVDSLSLNI